MGYPGVRVPAGDTRVSTMPMPRARARVDVCTIGAPESAGSATGRMGRMDAFFRMSPSREKTQPLYGKSLRCVPRVRIGLPLALRQANPGPPAHSVAGDRPTIHRELAFCETKTERLPAHRPLPHHLGPTLVHRVEGVRRCPRV